jgi:hypothetical protein
MQPIDETVLCTAIRQCLETADHYVRQGNRRDAQFYLDRAEAYTNRLIFCHEARTLETQFVEDGAELASFFTEDGVTLAQNGAMISGRPNLAKM